MRLWVTLAQAAVLGTGLAGSCVAVAHVQGQQQAALEAARGTGRWSSLISIHIRMCLFPKKKLLLPTASSTGFQRRERQGACFLLPPSVITKFARTGLPWQWVWRSVPWFACPLSRGRRGIGIKHIVPLGKRGGPTESRSVE